MALVLKDRVKVTTLTTGTGAVTLGAALFGYQDFSGFTDGDTTYYAIVDNATGEWETGVGTYASAGPSLTRTSVLASSTGSAIAFGAGPKDVFVVYPAGRAVTTDGNVTMTGPLSVPAGASGTQVPQAQEVVPKVGGAARIPSWTTAGRPSSPANGDTGLNTTLGVLETWDATNAFWKPLSPIRTSSVSVVGSAYDFTGIPAGIRKLRLTFSQLSSNDGNSFLIRLGDAGGVKTAGYVNAGGGVGGASQAGSYNTTGLEIFTNVAAGSASGHIDMESHDGVTWVTKIVAGYQGPNFFVGGGEITLSSRLTTVRVTKKTGGTLDAGTAYITMEA